MGKDPLLVTVAIPAYNHARYLDQAVRSVLAQDYPQVELIVLDDGSTDNTREVLACYGNRFHWETQRNMGQAAALNKAWGMANGEILGYLSADDYLLPGAITKSMHALRSRPEAVVAYCDFELVDPAGVLVRRVRAADFNLERMLLDLACPPGPGALFRRSAFKIAGGWNPKLRLMSDFDYWLRLSSQGGFVRVPEPLAAWRAHAASQSFGAVDEKKACEPVQIIEAFFSALAPDSPLAPLKSRSLARACLVSGQLHARSSRYRAALKCAVGACRLHPAIVLKLATWRLVANAMINQPAHRLLWKLRARGRR